MTKSSGEGSVGDANRPLRTDFSVRLQGLLAEFGNRSSASEVALVVPEQLGRYARGLVKPPLEVIARLAEAKGVSLDWLWTGEGPRKIGGEREPAPGDTIAIELVDLSGRVQEKSVVRRVPVPRELVAQIAVPDDRLRAAFAPDRMNEPMIRDGDLLLFDCGVDEVDVAAFYLFRRDQFWLLRWTEFDLRGGVSLKGSPGDKTQVLLNKEDLAEVQIVGRVVWRAGQV